MESSMASSPDVEMVVDGSSSSKPATPSSELKKESNGKYQQQQYKALWEYDGNELKEWVMSIGAIFKDPSKVPPEVAAQAWTNLEIALNSLQTKKVEYSNNNNGNDDDDEHVAKRIKTENGKTGATNKVKIKYELVDPFNLILHTIRRPDGEDDVTYEDMIEEAAKELKTTMGGKLTQLVVSGLVNAIAGVPTGLVQDRKWTVNPSLSGNTKQITTAANASMQQLKQIANSLHQTIQTRLENDVLVTTPIRIQEMLSPDLLPHEFKSIRKRIYETVILGKGIGRPTLEGEDLPTANSAGVHEVEKYKRCKSCGNNDQSSFVLDRKNGDVICSACGTVASEALMHEGSAYRKFEGEVDRNHHGDSANPLYSNAHNMSTTLGGISITTGAGLGGFGSQKKGLETVLRNAHAFTELNISQFGKGDRRTRIGYKDKQKKDAFMQMTHVGDALNLHEAVVQRAKELFAGFRDDRELVQQFKGVIAACLCEAFDQLSSDGRQILKQKEEAAPTETFVKSSRRNGLHHANLAGKGGLLLDFDAIQKKDKNGDNDGTAPQPAGVAQKPAPKWDLDDCRTWLLEASRSIAQRWIEDRKKGVKGIPTGTQDELEGSLVEHAITLCDLLEAELQQGSTRKGGASSTTNGRSSRAVVTPRAADMAKLGIKWQHSHERGSGGRGGIGNSGQRPLAAGAAQKGRTAGQILILKTAKKLGSMLKDEVVGTAIHKELRSLVGQQEAKKRQLMREEATRQRMAQMKRKSYLQLKALS